MLHHGHIIRAVGLAAFALAIGGVTSASAQPPATETISATWAAGPGATSAPYRGFGNGTFNATGAIADAGSLAIQGHDGGVPSPTVATVHTDQTLTSADGTLELRCNQISNDFTDLSAVPAPGQCAIIAGTGVYAQLHGQGTITGIVNLITRIETDTIVLSVA